jgi:hypothetical protein
MCYMYMGTCKARQLRAPLLGELEGRKLLRKLHAACGKTEAARRMPLQAKCGLGARPVLSHLASYFYNWPVPVRIWPICRPEGAGGTYSPRCRGQWPYAIPWPLCSLCRSLAGGGGGIDQAELQAQTHPKPAATASRRARWAVPCGYGHWGSKQSELNH